MPTKRTNNEFSVTVLIPIVVTLLQIYFVCLSLISYRGGYENDNIFAEAINKLVGLIIPSLLNITLFRKDLLKEWTPLNVSQYTITKKYSLRLSILMCYVSGFLSVYTLALCYFKGITLKFYILFLLIVVCIYLITLFGIYLYYKLLK